MKKQENIIFDYTYCALSCHIKHVGNKVWNASYRGDFERMHEAWLRKNVYFL
jgi:hypothetical protein